VSELARLETRAHGRLLVGVVTGEIDMSNAEDLEARLVEATKETDGLVLDLTGVTFIDSAGVRLLDHLVAAADAEPALRVVTAAEGPVPFTLRLCGFPEQLRSPSVDEALAALGTPPE
jgi:anti-sigma B factor antagonist